MTHTKSILIFLFFSLLAADVEGQNNLALRFDDPRFHEIQLLYTDTAVIKVNTQTRYLAFEYDAFNRPTRYRETSQDSVQNQFQLRRSECEYSLHRVVYTDSIAYTGAVNFTQKGRTTIDTVPGTAQLSSTMSELWTGTEWQSNQIVSYTYTTGGKIAEIFSKKWDFVQNLWQNDYLTRYEYDAQGNQIKLNWSNWDLSKNDWRPQSERIHEYNAMNQLVTEISRGQIGDTLSNSSKSYYTYDAAGRLDSIRSFSWVPPPYNYWKDYNYVTLDDSPEQQITQQGHTYKPKAPNEWYLAEKHIYVSGPQIFTDQYAERSLQVFDPNTGQPQDKQKISVNYIELPDKVIKGEIRRVEFVNGAWKPALQVDAWMRRAKSVRTLEPQRVAPLPTCGLSNPLSAVQAFTGVEMPDNALFEVFSMNGQRAFSGSAPAIADLALSSLPPAIYWVVVYGENGAVCTQKVLKP
jgi:hypothetical protein